MNLDNIMQKQFSKYHTSCVIYVETEHKLHSTQLGQSGD